MTDTRTGLAVLMLLGSAAAMAEKESDVPYVPEPVRPGTELPYENDTPEPIRSGPTPVYRMVDEDGNVIFTDEPPEGAVVEEVQIRPTNTVPAIKPRPAPEPSESGDKAAVPTDFEIVITEPEAEQTFQNPQDPIKVAFTVVPKLPKNFTTVLMVNDESVAGQQVPTGMPRGEHRLRISVLSEAGEEVDSSEAISIYIHRPTIKIQAK